MGKTLAAILLGTVVSLTGCELTPAAREIGLGLMIHGAKEGISGKLNPSGTNVNIYNQGQSNQRKLEDEYILESTNIPPSFICLGIVDTNRDGVIEKSELIGLGSYFECKKAGESIKIMCGTTWDKVQGKKAMAKIKETNTGRILGVREFPPFIEDRKIMAPSLYFTKKPGIRGIISYTAEWYIDGKKIPTRNTEFIINYGE